MGKGFMFVVRDEKECIYPVSQTPQYGNQEPGRRSVESTPTGLRYTRNLSRSDLPFFIMRDNSRKGKSTKLSNGLTSSAERHRHQLILHSGLSQEVRHG